MKRQSLSTQLQQAEQQVFARQQAVAMRLVQWERNVRGFLSSPRLLIAAGAIGFVSGEIAKYFQSRHRRVAVRERMAAPPVETAMPNRLQKMLNFLLLLSTLVGKQIAARNAMTGHEY